MSTSTKALLTADEARMALAEARATQAQVLERITAGDPKVKPADLTDAEAQVSLAELRLDAAEQHDRDRSEQRRIDRIAEVRARVANGDLRAQLDRVVKLFDAALALLGDLHATATDYQAGMSATVRELRSLGAADTYPDAVRIRGDAATVDGVHLAGDLRLPAELIAEAAREALAARIGGAVTGAAAAGGHGNTTLRALRTAAPFQRASVLRARRSGDGA